jgi:hypothetical protein
MKKREQMTFDLDLDQVEMLEIISRHTGIPVKVLLIQAVIRYAEKRGVKWPEKHAGDEGDEWKD